jgi:asparagine synthase (glutamine-hydrolysing)
MCGIAGIFRFRDSQLAAGDAACIERMADLLRHRGPDARGCTLVENCALAGLRLSILDLSPLGDQPMVSDDGRFALVYNGEIYNYVELHDELAKQGVRFRGSSDTEVVLRAYETWGASCISRFVGMWAFALFDARERRLLLSRDRFGVKPLYYVLRDDVLAFASEIKALAAFARSNGLPLRPSRRSLATYVGTGLVDGIEETFFEGVYRFPAASNGFCTSEGLRCESYWSLPQAAATHMEGLGRLDELSVAEHLRHRLDEAVRIHLRSDVPVGVCLSGGLDSSTVVGLAARHVEQVKTFTVYFDEGPLYDERAFSDRVVSSFHADSLTAEVKPDRLLAELGDILWHLDEPSLATGVIPQWHVMRLASQRVKVVLDGQGGDEVFGGYVPYYTQYLYQLARDVNAPRFVRETWGLASMLGGRFAGLAARNAVAMALRPPREGDARAPDGFVLAQEMRSLVDDSFEEWREWPRVFDDWLSNVLYWELTRTRLPALLRYEDRLSMAFSIESRVPLLDHRVVEFAFALPAWWKIRNGWSKWVLRTAVQGMLPDDIAWRRDKRGFPTPFGRWLRNGLSDDVRDLLFTSGRRSLPYFDRPNLARALDKHETGTVDVSSLLWRALSIELWLARFEL